MNRITNMCLISVLSAILSFAVAIPLMSRLDEITAIEYLENFGYLQTPDDNVANLINEKEISEAIKDLQYNFRLNETGILDAATKNMMSKPRCGLKDERRRNRHKRYILKGPKWDKTHLTWSLNSRKPNSEIGMIRRDLHDAFAVWQKDSALTFQEVNSRNADIIIEFHRLKHNDGFDFTGPGNTLAHAFYPGPGIGGDVHFDDDEYWVFGKDTEDKYGVGSSFFGTAVHEIGHALGLSHSNEYDSVMVSVLLGGNKRYQALYDDDVGGIRELYGFSNNIDNRPIVREKTTPRPHRITTRTPTQAPRKPVYQVEKVPDDKPDTCKSSYDALTIFRNELFIFKNQYMWRVSDHGVMAGYPLLTRRMWDELPKDFKKIDAVYENARGKIVFFIGKFFYTFDANRLLSKRPLTDLGLPLKLANINAIFIWGFNKKTFIFSGADYWKFDEDTQKVELDYPRKVNSIWKNVNRYDTAFQKDNITYFFHKNVYYKFEDKSMRLLTRKPSISSYDFMKCPKTDEDIMALEYMQFSAASTNKVSGVGLLILVISLIKTCTNI